MQIETHSDGHSDWQGFHPPKSPLQKHITDENSLIISIRSYLKSTKFSHLFCWFAIISPPLDLLVEFFYLPIQLTSGAAIDLASVQITNASIFEQVGTDKDKLWKLKFAGTNQLQSGDSVDNFQIGACGSHCSISGIFGRSDNFFALCLQLITNLSKCTGSFFDI